MPRLSNRDPDRDLKILLTGSAGVENKSAADIAAAMGVSPRSAFRYLKNPGELSLNRLRQLARCLNIPVDKFREAVKF